MTGNGAVTEGIETAMTAHMLVHSDGVTPIARSRGAESQVIRASVYGALALADMLVVFIAFAAADFLRHGRFTDSLTATYYLIVPVYLSVAFYARAYSYGTVVSRRRGLVQVFTSMLGAIALTLVLIFAIKGAEDVSRVAFFAGSMMSFAALVAIRLPLPALIRRLGPRFMRRLLVVDGEYNDPTPPNFERIDAPAAGVRPEIDEPMMLNRFSRLVQGADRVVVACPIEHRAAWSRYLKSVDCAGELLVPELRSVEPLGADAASGLVGIRVSTGRMDLPNRVMKRLFDLAVTVPAVVVLTPVMVLVAIAIALDSRGPILFRQQRMGRANQLFDVYKFRSMHVQRADATGDRSASRDDDRVTRVGRFIRATSLDELPQLFNIINGDMSLVGPRPHALGSRAGDALFWHIDDRYWLRHAIKPGLTGLAQVRGFRGATENKDDLTRRLESDIEYLTDWSVLTDIVILVRTAFVLVHRNAY